jgi:hypothetical protein
MAHEIGVFCWFIFADWYKADAFFTKTTEHGKRGSYHLPFADNDIVDNPGK